ncbi:three-helix bundle dimerization domain-containing protein [Nocardioides ungokensis]|uniref:three-helix bundle dimerization domain-containing protein n=1 Tax=Nocardioides ungokensis TaxID=1643322 RepID=UPI0015DF3C32|nr:hypothetical protein [Nocardioides ungokensis]
MSEPSTAGSGEAQALQHLSQRLRHRLPHQRAATINQAIADAMEEFDGRPIRDFVPILVEREVLDRLRQAGAGGDVRGDAEASDLGPRHLAV